MVRILIVACLVSVLMGGCLVGCAKDRTFDQQMTMIREAVKIAEDSGVMVEVDLEHDGRIGGYYDQNAGIDTGVRLKVRFRSKFGDKDAKDGEN